DGPTLDASAPAFIPDRYIRDQAQRLYYYQRMMSVREAADLQEVRQEVLDRYGRLPKEAENAFRIVRLRLHARDLGIDKIEAKGGRVAVWFVNRAQIPPLVFSNVGKRKPDAYLTRENLIWPYSGDAVDAVERFFRVFQEEMAAVEAARSVLK
ncbi:MAG: TRCF domain-containing protein, partial [Fimbriimonadaceae bacterium]